MIMIERVAKAIAEDRGFCWDDMPLKTMSFASESRDWYLRIACVALTAMRAPTDAMVNFSDDQFDWGPPGYESAPQGAAGSFAVWQAMIDAALKEGQQ